MRLIDADALEKEGWELQRYKCEEHTSCVEKRKISDVPTVTIDCSPLRPGDIVRNNNNYSLGVVLALMNNEEAAQILEISVVKKSVFVNCPPLRALEKTGKRIDLGKAIKEAVCT